MTLTEVEKLFAELLVVLEGRTDYALAVLELLTKHLNEHIVALDAMKKEYDSLLAIAQDLDRRATAVETVVGMRRGS